MESKEKKKKRWKEFSSPSGVLIVSVAAKIKTGFVEYFYPSKLIYSTSATVGYTISLKKNWYFSCIIGSLIARTLYIKHSCTNSSFCPGYFPCHNVSIFSPHVILQYFPALL